MVSSEGDPLLTCVEEPSERPPQGRRSVPASFGPSVPGYQLSKVGASHGQAVPEDSEYWDFSGFCG
jgi:hypothetical protein